MKTFLGFFRSKYFWVGLSVLLGGFLMGVFSEHSSLLALIFLTDKGVFNFNVLIGITGIYSFVYTIYLNARKEEMEVKIKPRLKNNHELFKNITHFIVLSTNLTTDINRTIGDQLYDAYNPVIIDQKNKLDEEISAMYSEFKDIREKIILNISIYSANEKFELTSNLDKIHENIKDSMTIYNNCKKILDNIQDKRESMEFKIPDGDYSFVPDVENPTKYVNKEVLKIFKNEFKKHLKNSYNFRKDARESLIDYFSEQEKNNFF